MAAWNIGAGPAGSEACRPAATVRSGPGMVLIAADTTWPRQDIPQGA